MIGLENLSKVKTDHDKDLADFVEGSKPSNPKQQHGVKKIPFRVIPAPVIAEIGLAMLDGACKYGSHNYRDCGVRASTYYDAAVRHLTAWWEGEDIDPDSGLPHLAKAMSSLVVLRDSQMFGNDTDDRPISYKPGWQIELNKQVEKLLEKYPNPKEPYVRS